jgi:hypothetical protein
VRFAHLSARYPRGLFSGPAGLLHVSPGLGTTFVPFRFLARPEATMLVLHSPDWPVAGAGLAEPPRIAARDRAPGDDTGAGAADTGAPGTPPADA